MAPFGVDIPSLKGLASSAAQAAAQVPQAPQTPGAKPEASKGPAWRQALKPASFRGVPFFVEQDEQEGGRRTVVHEFPGRDAPYTEDMGRKAGAYSVEGYVLGADYMSKRDALLTALNAEGPGVLIVPWMAERKVNCTGLRLRQSASEGGMARFSLTFAEAGQAATPTASALPGVLADTKADKAIEAVGKVLDQAVKTSGVPLPVLTETLSGLHEMLDKISGYTTISGLVANLPDAAKNILNVSPADLAAMLPSELLVPLYQLSDLYSDASANYAVLNEGYEALSALYPDFEGDYAELASLLGYDSASPSEGEKSAALAGRVEGLLALAEDAPDVEVPAGAGLVRTITAQNLMALSDYQRSAAVAEAARSAALVKPESRQEAAALREQIVEAIDTVLDSSTDQAVYTAFTELRTATVQSLAASSGSAPELSTVRSPAVLPSLVVAQNVAPGADATQQEAQLLTRNPVRHPGFMPPGDLEVLRAV